MSPIFFKIMKKIVRRLDPKLEKYRALPEEQEEIPYVPETKEELIQLLARTPVEILSKAERTLIASTMSINERPISTIMLPKKDITFVHENDFLGPLLLDELYKSGLEHFPVLGASGRITGMIHLSDLNKIEQLSGKDRIRKYLSEDVYYLREDNSLEKALAAFIRTNCYFFIVLNHSGNPVGLLDFQSTMEAIFGRPLEDDFDADLDAGKVAARK